MLTSPGRADEQNVGRRFQVAAGAQFVDQRPVDPGGGIDVEVGQGGRGRQAGEPQPARQPRVVLASTSTASSRSSATVSDRPSAVAWSRTDGRASAAA